MVASRLSIYGVVLSLVLQGALGCLPKDDRPPPGNLLITASSDSAVQQGFDTDDGWHIQFSKFVVSPGHSSFRDGGSCTSYSDASYEHVLNVLQAGSQKVNLIYARGTCDFRFRLSFPGADAVVGDSISAQDLLLMRTGGTDRFQPTISGANGYIAGVASKQSQTKTFAWLFRQSWSYANCSIQGDAGSQASVQLGAYQAETLNITVRGEELFENVDQSNTIQLLFEPMAQADSTYGNNDGEVTLNEMSKVPTNGFSGLGTSAPHNGIDAGPGDFASDAGVLTTTDLETLVYQVLYPSMFHYGDSGKCQASPAQNGDGPGGPGD